MRTAITLPTPEMFSAHSPSSSFIAPIRHWARHFRLAAAATAICDLEFNPFQSQIVLRTPAAAENGPYAIRNGEWWDMYFKAKTEYDLMRSHVVVNCDPCLPAVRWDGSAMPERDCPKSRH